MLDRKVRQKTGGFEFGSAASVRTAGIGWPLSPERHRVRWFPARQRLIGLIRASTDSFVLPPAIVRKASWRD